MKTNIDLTENQLFSRGAPEAVIRLSRIMNKGVFPWSLSNFLEARSDDELDLDHQKKSLIALGDKEKRAEIAEYRKMDSGNYCDCCGARMRIKPWIGEMGLCQKCNEDFMNEFREKYPWNRGEIGTSERRGSVFDMN